MTLPADRRFDAGWRARFERFGSTYVDEASISGWSAGGLSRRSRLLRRLLADLGIAPGLTLELGCGPGTHVRFLAGQGHRVIGVDYSVPTLRRAVEADPDGSGRYVGGDGYALPFRAGAFDAVLCLGVLQAVARPEHVVDEIARVLRRGGIVVLETLNSRAMPTLVRRVVEVASGRPAHLRAHAPARVAAWLAARGVRVLRRVPVYLPPRGWPALGWLLDRRAVGAVLDTAPGVAIAAAHAFWFVGSKRA
ncbi:MAG TPA: class I SAM-dependent methyltransferase [Candidatus Tectomicrobia bacterium]|nr:class I SAM-dependent methyltransferase [Candidatus Tectomicrobia bacterium]